MNSARPEPNKVFVAPDVNAACISRTSLINLFVEPKRDLLIGLGLVNCTNLSEFKAVLAHEFGHFCHLGHTSSYTVVVKRIIFDLVEGEDWFDRLIEWNKRQENVLSWFGHAIGGCLWVGRQVLWWMLKTITLQDRAVSREQEFHADLVAVSAAGSDASTHGLLRARFGMQCFMQAVDDLATALDHKLYSNDLYLHQDRAAAVVRRKKKEPELGLPPALRAPRRPGRTSRSSTPSRTSSRTRTTRRRCGGPTRPTPTARRTPRSSSSPRPSTTARRGSCSRTPPTSRSG